jgi:DNA-binding beta-propeller fold protein YncE/outer membrane murein-binding lipoprotein Lpp
VSIGKKGKLLILGAVALAGLVAAACTSGGVSQEAYDNKAEELQVASGQIKAKEQELTQLQQQLTSIAPSTVVQAGQLQPAPAGAQATGWDTAESIRGGLKLVATYDSSGPDAWDVKAHPMVYFTSTGGPNLFPGLHVIDAYSKEVIAQASYDLGAKVSPHTVGASPDGKWLYLQGARLLQDGKTEEAVTFIINAKTLKLDKVLKQESMMQGSLRVQRLHHTVGFADWQGRDRLVLEYGFGSSGGPHFILDPKDNNRVVKAITIEDTGYWMGHPFVTVDPTGKFLFVSLKMAAWGTTNHGIAGVAKINLETNAVKVITGVGDHLIGMMVTADGKILYVNDAENGFTYKIDLTTDTVVGKAASGVTGQYGLALNWDETLLYTVGKGENGPNEGHNLGVIDTKTFRGARSNVLGVNLPIELGEGSRTVDHAFLHPDPAVNELWVSNMGGTVTTVLDLKTNTVKARILVPNGGTSTHSSAFVKYNADWTGKVLADHGGPKAEMLATRLAMAQAAAAKK